MSERGAKIRKRVIIAAGVIVVVFLAAGLVAGNVLYNLALNPSTDKSSVTEAEHNQIEQSETQDPDRDAASQWAESVSYADRYMESYDGLTLHSYVLEQPGDKWAILCHGYTSQGAHMSYAAYQFNLQGYNLLIPDARGHGESEGGYIGMGWHDRLDIVDWIDQILQWNPEAQIALYGVSMGGATVMMVSGEPLPDNVRVIVEDCGYTGAWDEFAYQLNMLFKLPAFPVMHFSSLVTRLRAGWWLGEASAVEQVEKSVTPMMFIHGDADTFVPAEMVHTVYAAADVPKELLVVEGAGHGASASELGAEYWRQVFNFVDRFMD